MLRRRNGSQTARPRTPCADRELARARSVQTCDFQTLAVAKRDTTASLRNVSRTLQNGAVEST
eukprot:85830-Lingulodinium_polyedra.AAC.1